MILNYVAEHVLGLPAPTEPAAGRRREVKSFLIKSLTKLFTSRSGRQAATSSPSRGHGIMRIA